MNARQMIKDKISDIRQHIATLSPGELSEALVELSSLYATFSEGLTELENKYLSKKLEFLWHTEGETRKKVTVSEATLLADVTPEGQEYFEAKRLERALVEIIRSIKVRIRVLGNEWEVASNT